MFLDKTQLSMVKKILIAVKKKDLKKTIPAVEKILVEMAIDFDIDALRSITKMDDVATFICDVTNMDLLELLID